MVKKRQSTRTAKIKKRERKRERKKEKKKEKQTKSVPLKEKMFSDFEYILEVC